MSFDFLSFRKEFPQLQRRIGEHSLVYFDNAATTLKPRSVVQRLSDYYLNDVANIHRGAHFLSRQGTEMYEAVRQQIAQWIGAASSSEVVFTRGTTESINLVAYAYGEEYLSAKDVILLSPFEHHSNIIPWKIISEKTGCRIEVLPFDQKGQIAEGDLDKVFSKNVKLVSLMLYSNVTGVRLDVETVFRRAQKQGAVTVLDAAQAPLHEKLDATSLQCDFLALSAHKMFGPFGVGFLYGKNEILDKMQPFQGGGSMISLVTWEKTVYQDVPFKFEAGTPNIADVIAFGEAIRIVQEAPLQEWQTHGAKLGMQIEDFLSQQKSIRLMGPRYGEAKKTDIVSFVYGGVHASDVGEILDQMGVAVRAGHHCAQPLMSMLDVSGTVRVSLAPYNNTSDVDLFCQAMEKAGKLL